MAVGHAVNEMNQPHFGCGIEGMGSEIPIKMSWQKIAEQFLLYTEDLALEKLTILSNPVVLHWVIFLLASNILHYAFSYVIAHCDLKFASSTECQRVSY